MNGGSLSSKDVTLMLVSRQDDEIKWLRKLVWISFIVGLSGYGLAGAAKLGLV